MFFHKFKLILLFWISSMGYAYNNDFIIRTSVDMKYAFCDVKTNGVSGANNRSSVSRGGIGFGSTSTNSMILMENGENTITIELASLNWFSQNDMPQKERNIFHPNARCEIVVNKMDDQGNIIPLTRLMVKINEDGQPEAYENNKIDPSIEKKIILASNTEKIESDKILQRVNEKEYPKDMTVFQFNKKINISDLPKWPWIEADKYEDTPKQRELLQAAYLELWTAFEQQDDNKIKQLLTPSLEVWATSTGGNVDEQFASREIGESFSKQNFQMIPINWNNFQPLIMNNGKMVKLVYKEDFDFSPISYRFTTERGTSRVAYHSPIFSFVNGKFIPVI